MTFTPNPDGEDGHRGTTAVPIERFAAAVGEIGKSYLGRPQPEILAALLSAARDAGFAPNEADLARLAEHLSEAQGNTGY